MKQLLSRAFTIAGCLMLSTLTYAADWKTSEIHHQYGELDIPTFAIGGSEPISIDTFQYANGWKNGDNFMLLDSSGGSQQGHDNYGENYSNFNLGEITGKDFSFGPVNDIGIFMGYNWGDDAMVRKYSPAVRFAFDAPDFSFLNLVLTSYIDDNRGVASAAGDDHSYMIDTSWSLPSQWEAHAFSFDGHLESIGRRDNEFGRTIEGHQLAQPQSRYDLGKFLWHEPKKLFVGAEIQYWDNEYGDKATDQRVIQTWVVSRF